MEMIPEPLASINDPIAKSIVAAFVARKNYISKEVHVKPKDILEQLDYASHLLADSLTLASCKKREDLVQVSPENICFQFVQYFLYCFYYATRFITV